MATLLQLSSTRPLTTAVALDGLQAVDLASTRRPDVAVLDIEMPGLNGFQVALQLRAVFEPRVRLIAMSATMQHVVSAREGTLFDHALQKPLNISLLLQLVLPAPDDTLAGVAP